jgi:hypothetical protein
MRYELTLKLGPFLEALSRTAVYQSPKMLRDARTAGSGEAALQYHNA